jgi:hypothetical protein
VTEFNYLGVTFTKNGKFKLAKQKNIEKATKAMYEVIRRGKRHNLSIECLLDLFDKIQEVYIFCSSARGKNHNFCVLFIMITSQISFQVKWALDKVKTCSLSYLQYF